LQVFHTDVAKVDQYVAFVAVVVYVCCKLLFTSFFADVCCKCQVCLFVAYVLHIYCKCFIRMLRMFYNGFQVFFLSISDVCFKCFICLHTYVACVASGCFKSRSGVAFPSSLSAASHRCLLSAPAGHPPTTSPLVTFRVTRTPCGGAKQNGNKLQEQTSGRPVHPDVRALASPLVYCNFLLWLALHLSPLFFEQIGRRSAFFIY
jgi:hypothetical protein